MLLIDNEIIKDIKYEKKPLEIWIKVAAADTDRVSSTAHHSEGWARSVAVVYETCFEQNLRTEEEHH
jgi:hypothetical protein